MYNKHFWIVWNPNGTNPRHRHTDEQSAFREAERLASKHPNQEFFVLVALGGAEKVDVKITRFDDIPF